MIIAVDFDGTLVEDNFPNIGETKWEIVHYIQHQQEHGSKIILWTCRQGKELIEAIAWCAEHGIDLDAVNEDLPETIEKYGQSSRKILADIYIDDHSVTPFYIQATYKDDLDNKPKEKEDPPMSPKEVIGNAKALRCILDLLLNHEI